MKETQKEYGVLEEQRWTEGLADKTEMQLSTQAVLLLGSYMPFLCSLGLHEHVNTTGEGWSVCVC